MRTTLLNLFLAAPEALRSNIKVSLCEYSKHYISLAALVSNDRLFQYMSTDMREGALIVAAIASSGIISK